ncbi:MAG: undecaprenyl/decaprenyl-phosphate alpha-N-acetylglucosaminyl 1-phosphate transferase [Candidatus Peribacteraceae bacterium]|nr:undecaprenyl/decaprenyl-phosphate alpha-N-acetylglucosaminyl 1-phosphate transferase [Candidatus Peribacteraceae bacterium]
MNFYPLAFAFTLTLFLTISAIKFFPRWGLLDDPKRYGLKRAPIPYFGGIAIFIACITSILIFVPLTKEVLGLIAGATLLTTTAFLDDAFRLPPLVRLTVQIIAAGILVISGLGIDHITNPFGGIFNLAALDWNVGQLWGGEYHLTLLADLFTVGWVVLLTNSLNWLDGVPGLSSGIASLAALVIFFLAVRTGYHYFDQSAVIALAAILAGGALAFTVFNFPPPKILLGDSGSMLLGFILAALAVFSGGKVATAALVLGFPLLDAFWVVLRRVFSGQSPFRGDYGHLHHRLLAAGFSPRKTVAAVYLASAAFGAIALFIDDSFGKLLALGGLFLVMLGVGWKLRNAKLKSEL